MTQPDCCTQAWAKATGTKELFPCEGDCTFGGCPHWFTSYGNFPNTRCPAPTSAEWLADCINGFLLTGWNVELGIFLGTPFAMLRKRLTDPQEVRKGTGWDEFSALCAALNGSPCERKAA